MIAAKYKNYLSAWRRLLDRDGSNHCNWEEFQAACRKVGFVGDVAGAWRALDEDLSGSITLHEIDPPSSDILCRFRQWADLQFGGVKSAFGVFDADGGLDISYKE